MSSGKHVFITGGARGIGRAIALGLARDSWKVTVTARTQSDLDETATELKKITKDFLCLKADISNRAELSAAIEKSFAAFGAMDGLICAAAIHGVLGSFAEIPFEEWQKTIEVNLTGTARTIHMCLPKFNPKDSRVVLFSGGGQGPMPNFSGYVSSKGGIWRMTETLAVELKDRNIFINSIAPGAVNTKLLDNVLAAGPEKVGKEAYEKSLQQKESGGQSSEKAVALCKYLLSEKSKGLYGKTLSAIWDPYEKFENLEALSKSDIFTYRRVVDKNGNTRG